ncbi:MAG: formylglycine-generating enzyme family protein [Bilophila wadsworthia]
MGTPSPPSAPRTRPVVEVSWHEAQEFTRKYTEWLLANAPQSLPGFQGDDRNTAFVRLPTEAEWEYAARGAQKVSPLSLSQEDFFEMPMGDAIKNYAVFRDSEGTSEETLQRIGSRKPNPAGFYDMAGNAAEMQDGFQFSLGGRLHGSTGGFIRKGGGFRPRRMRSCPDGGKKWPFSRTAQQGPGSWIPHRPFRHQHPRRRKARGTGLGMGEGRDRAVRRTEPLRRSAGTGGPA